ncbi:uncharacterized protein LOC142613040 [Castanea sativa]|uniref:uncharacterized protein LOC142613040 n=1 Tax=Castanea sativa TaxID=21020 RepID=UPI003F64AF88
MAAGARSMVVYSDSQIMTSQVNGSYECRSERMKRCLATDESDYVMKEVHEGICGNHSGSRYGIPKVLVSNNEKQFDNDAFRDFCSQLGVKNHYSSPTHLTTMRTPTRETPLQLAYGSEAIISAEVGLTSYRVGNYDESKNDEAMRLQLDLVDEVRATAEQRLARYQDLMAKHYNSKVRHRDFQVGDLVLRRVLSATKDAS